MNTRTEKENLFVLAALFLVSLSWSLLRSSTGDSIAGTLDDWLKHPGMFLIIACIIPAIIWMARSEARAIYFFAASPALGMLPPIPHLPFLQQFSHIALIVVTIAAYRHALRENRKIGFTKPLVYYFIFLAIAAVSICLNFIMHQSIWQLKVGVSNLIIPVVFGFYLLSVSSVRQVPSQQDEGLLRGFLDSALMLSVIGITVTVLLFVTPYSAGVNGICNDTIYGLGYCDRMQLMFTGPVAAGIFFVLAILFALGGSDKARFHAYFWMVFLQIAPWLVMASGSRVAKISLILVLIVGVWLKSFRRATILILPSAVLALTVSMYYQSLPFAVHDSISAVLPENIASDKDYSSANMRGRFFSDDERSQLLHTSIDFFRDAPLINQILGNGFGVAGFRGSSFPSPHNQILNILIDCGILGTIALLLFLYHSTIGIVRSALSKDRERREFSLMLLTALTCLVLFSMVYTILPQGITLVFFALMFAWAERHAPPNQTEKR